MCCCKRWGVLVVPVFAGILAVTFFLAGGCDTDDSPSSEESESAEGTTPESESETPTQLETASGDPQPLPGRELPLGLDPYEAIVPEDNPVTPEKIALGKALYFDTRLSKDNSISCASCHDPQKGYSDGRRFSLGVGDKKGGRNSPVITNRLFSKEQFWDGRAASLEEQALGPIHNPIEMSMVEGEAVERLEKIPEYAPMFEAAFGTPEITDDRMAKAIASFERTIVSGNSPFDRFEKKGDQSALNESEQRGLTLFRGKAKCSVCHVGFNFTDEKYHNIGVGMDAEEPDLGRYVVTEVEKDKGAFKTPTLRDIEHSAPYFHDGSAATLMEVVEHYDKGGIKNEHLSENIFALNLTDQEKQDLVNFMLALTGDDRTVSQAPQLPGL